MGDLGNIFEKRLKQLGLKKQVDASLVVAEAQKKINEIFGENAENNLRVISFNKGTLKIAARTSTWAAECQASFLRLKSEKIEKVIFCQQAKLEE